MRLSQAENLQLEKKCRFKSDRAAAQADKGHYIMQIPEAPILHLARLLKGYIRGTVMLWVSNI